MIEEFFALIEKKTKEGIKELKGLDIGTEKYKEMVSQIISNINLIKDKDQLSPQPAPKEFEPQSVIGKEFK